MSTRDDAGYTTTNLAVDDNKHKTIPNGVQEAYIQDGGLDEFGLPIRPASRNRPATARSTDSNEEDAFHDAHDKVRDSSGSVVRRLSTDDGEVNSGKEEQHGNNDAEPKRNSATGGGSPGRKTEAANIPYSSSGLGLMPPENEDVFQSNMRMKDEQPSVISPDSSESTKGSAEAVSPNRTSYPPIRREKSDGEKLPTVSEWSHQKLMQQEDEPKEEEEVEWQDMPAIDEYDVYDDDGRLVARGTKVDEEDVTSTYMAMGGMGKGYTRVLDDEDAKSATSMDEETGYLFQKSQKQKENQDLDANDIDEDDEGEERDAMTQLEATKDLLSEGQRIAYVGVVRLIVFKMVMAMVHIKTNRSTRKDILKSLDSIEMWGQGTMVKLYRHMDISSAEQMMIEQLAAHGVEATDLVHPLMQNAKVKNPMAKTEDTENTGDRPASRSSSVSQSSSVDNTSLKDADVHLKEVEAVEEVPEVHGPAEMPSTPKIELDIRWTVLCDLFLILLEGGVYDARSRRLLERVGTALKINWTQICRFEKRVMDQLEMQEAERENWDESEHIEDRRKRGLKRKYVVMGLATVGGGLVIGLSAGLLAPLIGAGLAAGFTTIGVTGTAGFLGGVGGAALITSAATAAGGSIAVKASHRRTGHVQTFEYRPLHNNKRLNLIISVSGWMTGKVDDVRLPFSTVDPIMGDIYSLYWEPEMLRSMGDTINILATEALTQTVQQVLGSTILIALMASLQLPIVLTKLAYLIDNPWTVSLDRANSAGLILADSLIARHLGGRPITLLGFSLGSRLIFSCLKELANRNAYGIVQNVYLFGSPIVAKKDDWIRARSVIAGRFVNGYASNDWILGYLFRATSGGIMKVAGLAQVEEIPGLENIDVTDIVNGHMAYRAAMPKLLKKVGWEVESEEFSEIEDPDPENHAERQRELIREIDEARKLAEAKPGKKRFTFFGRGKAEKKGWETYEVKNSPSPNTDQDGSPDLQPNVLFDIDAIRKELISEQIEIRELDSTLPPMQFTTVQNGEKKVEYLRLPPDMKPHEVAKMRLPPRPDELADPNPPMVGNSANRASSAHSSYRLSRSSADERSFDHPRELASSLPPLQISSSRNSTSADAEKTARPALIKHELEPVGLGLTQPSIDQDRYPYDLDDNAWASPGNEKEIKMTFE